jgi:molecular chaperone DnaK
MARQTIDFGIDLGTTNSEIAVVEKGQLQVIRNGFSEEITPSAVRIDKKGAVIRGKLAYNQRVDDRDNTHTQFKRLMGSQQVLSFPNSGRQMKPEELSAEILQSLRDDVRRTAGEEIESAVITIPAMFEAPQWNATTKAAQLAGLKFAPLLQEPIAAALAYGFQAESLEGFLLVYDLGGGTFDASLIQSAEGRLKVIDHSGDNFLGGKDFDEVLLDFFVKTLVRDFGLRKLDPNVDRKAFGKLLGEAENAKVLLSSNSSAYVSVSDLGRSLEDFDASFEVTRNQYESLIEPFVRKTLDICDVLLKSNNLAPSALSKVILVGGPTRTPFIQNAIREKLRLSPDSKVNPMTIVAQGAALFAASQRVPEAKTARLTPGSLRLKLVYSPASQDVETDIGGKFEDAQAASGCRIEITRTDGGWRSGQIPLSNGTFMIAVHLEARSVNDFQIRVFDKVGGPVAIEPDHFSITHGPTVEDAPLSRSIRLGLADNSAHLLIKKGMTVPCLGRTKRGEIVTAHEVIKGEQTDVLNIPLLHGEYERSDRNREIGTLRISGTQITRNLPAGTELELMAEVDKEFQVKVTAFIPLLNESFPSFFTNPLSPLPRLENMEADLKAEKLRLTKLSPADHQKADQIIETLEVQLTKANAKDPDAAEKARRQIEELKAEVDRVQELETWPALLRQLEEVKQSVTEAVQGSGESRDSERLKKLLADAESAVNAKDVEKLNKSITSLEALKWDIWFRQDDFWIASFHGVTKHAASFVDKNRGNSLIEEGSLAIERGDFASLRTIVKELWDLVPDSDESSKEKALFPSSLRKKTVGYL